MKVKILVFLTVIMLIAAGCNKTTKSIQGSVSERFISYYEEVAMILDKNNENAAKALESLKKFMAKYEEDYITVTNALNNYTDDEKAEFVKDYGKRLSDAFGKYFDIAFSIAGQDEEITKIISRIPILDVQAFDKFYPKEEE